jgi:hypothetical protein
MRAFHAAVTSDSILSCSHGRSYDGWTARCSLRRSAAGVVGACPNSPRHVFRFPGEDVFGSTRRCMEVKSHSSSGMPCKGRKSIKSGKMAVIWAVAATVTFTNGTHCTCTRMRDQGLQGTQDSDKRTDRRPDHHPHCRADGFVRQLMVRARGCCRVLRRKEPLRASAHSSRLMGLASPQSPLPRSRTRP